MKSLLVGLLVLGSISAFTAESGKNYYCSSEKSLIGSIYEGIRNTTRFNGNRGSYTGPIMFSIKENEDGSFNYEFDGQYAFCAPNEQCAGLYTIASGKTDVIFDGDLIKSDGNPRVKFSINTVTKKCVARILDFKIKKKLTRFKGELY